MTLERSIKVRIIEGTSPDPGFEGAAHAILRHLNGLMDYAAAEPIEIRRDGPVLELVGPAKRPDVSVLTWRFVARSEVEAYPVDAFMHFGFVRPLEALRWAMGDTLFVFSSRGVPANSMIPVEGPVVASLNARDVVMKWAKMLVTDAFEDRLPPTLVTYVTARDALHCPVDVTAEVDSKATSDPRWRAMRTIRNANALWQFANAAIDVAIHNVRMFYGEPKSSSSERAKSLFVARIADQLRRFDTDLEHALLFAMGFDEAIRDVGRICFESSEIREVRG